MPCVCTLVESIGCAPFRRLRAHGTADGARAALSESSAVVDRKNNPDYRYYPRTYVRGAYRCPTEAQYYDIL